MWGADTLRDKRLHDERLHDKRLRGKRLHGKRLHGKRSRAAVPSTMYCNLGRRGQVERPRPISQCVGAAVPSTTYCNLGRRGQVERQADFTVCGHVESQPVGPQLRSGSQRVGALCGLMMGLPPSWLGIITWVRPSLSLLGTPSYLWHDLWRLACNDDGDDVMVVVTIPACGGFNPVAGEKTCCWWWWSWWWCAWLMCAVSERARCLLTGVVVLRVA